MTVPAMLAVDCFIVNPFLAIASLNCLSMAVLPGFILTDASHSQRLPRRNRLQGRPSTRTTCAQTSQSMPKMLMSIDLISVVTETAVNNRDSSAMVFFIWNLLV